jgi:hypothetical protein
MTLLLQGGGSATLGNMTHSGSTTEDDTMDNVLMAKQQQGNTGQRCM